MAGTIIRIYKEQLCISDGDELGWSLHCSFPFSSFLPCRSLLHTFHTYPTHVEIIKQFWRGGVSL